MQNSGVPQTAYLPRHRQYKSQYGLWSRPGSRPDSPPRGPPGHQLRGTLEVCLGEPLIDFGDDVLGKLLDFIGKLA